jgi:16S rRNA (cytosine967-C5)-methyltransferase
MNTAPARRRDSLAPGAATLAAAAGVVEAVAHRGRSADQVFESIETRADRAAVRAIALGSLRWYLRLTPAIEKLLARPSTRMAPALHALLICAAHQIEYSRTAPEVSAHLAVDAARAVGQRRAAGFVNAVLRRFVTERAALFAAVDRDPAAASAHPGWFVAAVHAAWGDRAAALLAANNVHPPMTLRVDLTRGSVEEYLRELAAAGRVGRALDWAPAAVVLEHPAPVQALPGFSEGRVSVQDSGAQCAARLLAPQPGDRVLDACAAPGGKTGHLLEVQPALADLLAVDVDGARLRQVEDTLARLGRRRRVRLRRLDLLSPEALANEPQFDRILLDAPCSSTGVIRRHPDIKLLRRRGDLAQFVARQSALLKLLFAHLAPDGLLVYATCSVLPAENEAVVAEFLTSEPRAASEPWPQALPRPPGAIATGHGTQLLPGAEAGTDGFYYALLRHGRMNG